MLRASRGSSQSSSQSTSDTNTNTISSSSVSVSYNSSSENINEPRSKRKSTSAAQIAWRGVVAVGMFLLFAGLLSKIRESSQEAAEIQQHSHALLRSNGNSAAAASAAACTIWMAPSSLKGHPGYGIFTTRNIPAWESVLGGPDGLSVPIEAYRDTHRPNRKAKKAWIKVWDNYWWGRGVPDHINYYAGPDIVDYQIAFGALPNHHCILDSLHHQYPKDDPYNDTLVTGVDGTPHPATGAYTYSRGREFVVNRDVRAGEELFLSYGYCSREDEDLPSWTEHIYMREDFKQANQLIKEGLEYDKKGNLIVPNSASKLVQELLPTNAADYNRLVSDAEVNSDRQRMRYLASHYGLNERTPDWIRQNGMCMENLVPRPSSIPGAGQGAFAQFHMRAGEIVTPAPLLQIMNKTALDLYNEQGDKIKSQLLLNYCFGHSESSLLLCPDTIAVLVNHCSTRSKQCGSRGPNAAYRWSRGWDPSSDEWRTKSLEDLSMEAGRGLAFEIYALRDIAPGEEVFIDYGVEFEQAFAMHVLKWKPSLDPSRQISRLSAKKANEDESAPVPDEFIVGNLTGNRQHPYLFVGCQYKVTNEDYHKNYQDRQPLWESLNGSEILRKFADPSAGRFHYKKDKGYVTHSDTSHWPCTILRRENGDDDNYTVRIHQNPWEDELPWHENCVPRILTGYPRSSMHYFVHPYKSDQHQPGVFRHTMMIRDEMFPSQWKDLKATKYSRR